MFCIQYDARVCKCACDCLFVTRWLWCVFRCVCDGISPLNQSIVCVHTTGFLCLLFPPLEYHLLTHSLSPISLHPPFFLVLVYFLWSVCLCEIPFFSPPVWEAAVGMTPHCLCYRILTERIQSDSSHCVSVCLAVCVLIWHSRRSSPDFSRPFIQPCLSFHLVCLWLWARIFCVYVCVCVWCVFCVCW